MVHLLECIARLSTAPAIPLLQPRPSCCLHHSLLLMAYPHGSPSSSPPHCMSISPKARLPSVSKATPLSTPQSAPIRGFG
mmetsp:Transcript_7099/g.12527  ORF Transcript_7099/g.12527 Transcript_7099/m.12527 type:complete len:80 (-) Transcript_7099:1002-1241(-)